MDTSTPPEGPGEDFGPVFFSFLWEFIGRFKGWPGEGSVGWREKKGGVYSGGEMSPSETCRG
jgi:hypothetical protein